MTVIALGSLPLGFRFRPTDEEIVNHYLKRKINGRIKSEVEVIPEIDVCKCEPWDLPDKSLIRSDDPEWFFFAPKDRKYPNGHRSNRATEAGYWKATGKDRVIRSKPTAARSTIIGMKKTLVFHRGRAPKGVRTNWIMHEYRTTEPEFESGDQGGYVLYRLFKKPEEKSLSSNAEEVETNGFSPTPTKSSPGDTQHEADVMDETGTLLNRDSPKSDLQEEPNSSSGSVQKQPSGIKRWLADKVELDDEARVGEKDVLAQFFDPEYEQIDCDIFPHSGSPMLPYTGYPFVGNVSQELQIGSHPVDNVGEDTLNAFLISALNPDDCSSGASIFPKESFAVQKHSSWDSASFKDSGSSSDIDTEQGLPQCTVGSEASECFYGSSFLPTDSLQMDNSIVYPEMKTQLSTLYENASLLPYDITGPDAYSVDSGAESLQDLFNSMEQWNNQKTTSDSRRNFVGTGIKIRSRQMQQERPNSDSLLLQQGTAARRIRLQGSLRKVSFGIVRGESTNRDYNEEEESMAKAKQELCDKVDESVSEKNTMRNRNDLVETGIKIRARQVKHRPNDLLEQQGEKSTNFSQLCELQLGSASDSESSIRNNNDGKAERTEAGENVSDNISQGGESVPPAFLDKLEELSVHDADETPSSSSKYQTSKSVLRLRTKSTNDGDNMLKHSLSHPTAPRDHSVAAYMIYLVLSVALLLLCFGIWRCISCPIV